MSLTLFILLVIMVAISLAFGYNEGRNSCRHNPAEMNLRAAFEVMLVLESLELKGKVKGMTDAEKSTTAAMLAATKLSIFRKEYEKYEKANRSRAEKT